MPSLLCTKPVRLHRRYERLLEKGLCPPPVGGDVSHIAGCPGVPSPRPSICIEAASQNETWSHILKRYIKLRFEVIQSAAYRNDTFKPRFETKPQATGIIRDSESPNWIRWSSLPRPSICIEAASRNETWSHILKRYIKLRSEVIHSAAYRNDMFKPRFETRR